MKIAQISPLYESVPPKLYGGTERVVSYLTEALVNQGHDVTLFASGDSETQAELVPICPEALRLGIARQGHSRLAEEHLREPRAVVSERRSSAPKIRQSREALAHGESTRDDWQQSMDVR